MTALQDMHNQLAFLNCPLNYAKQIYAYALIHTMTPSPEEIYFPNESFTSLPPASLYFVNWQIHIELHATLATINTIGPLVLHINPQGKFYSSFSETAILVGRSRDISRASKLVLKIWPPHPDRPLDIFGIWRSARTIQRQLIQLAPLQGFWVQFLNNDLASWCPNGRILDTLWPYDGPEAQERDDYCKRITNLGQIFCRICTAVGRFQLGAGT